MKQSKQCIIFRVYMKPDLDICPESRSIKRKIINGKIVRVKVRIPCRSPKKSAPLINEAKACASPPRNTKYQIYLNEVLDDQCCLQTCGNMIKDISQKAFFKKLTTIMALEMIYRLEIKGTRKNCLQVAVSCFMIAYKYSETQDIFPKLTFNELIGWSGNSITRQSIVQMERHILNGLNYNIPHPDLNTFIDDVLYAYDQSIRKQGLLNLKNTPYYCSTQ